MAMNWPQLMCHQRVGSDGSVRSPSPEPARSHYERDWDRVLFSTAFRRMHDKTQVFPLPEDDVVHSRLTHSLEVASVGRSLGKRVGSLIAGRSETNGFTHHDVGDVVAAACLAHDIGNPPFGHAGEDAIGAYFRSDEGRVATTALTAKERNDLEAFEGNAQGLRLVSRLQLEPAGGLQLTAATLAAFMKYPREVGSEESDGKRASRKKHGVFQEELHILSAVARATGLVPSISGTGRRGWCRHPLAFLVEAADDICYSILDIEDGVRLAHVEGTEAEALLRSIAARAPGFKESYLDQFRELKGRIGYLRAMAIGKMIEECATVFLDNETKILTGEFDVSLGSVIPSAPHLKSLTALAKTQCYTAPDVIEIELAGYEALGGLLKHFVPAALATPGVKGQQPLRQEKVLALLKRRGVLLESALVYSRILRITDFVSGMTDRHALATFRRINGIAIPGRVG